jgi:putative DNA primase/helicase
VIGDLHSMARALGGEVKGSQVSCPGPGQAPTDRSLSVRVSANSPLAFNAHSRIGQDCMRCRDYVAGRLARS